MRDEGSVLHCLDSEAWKKETWMSCFQHLLLCFKINSHKTKQNKTPKKHQLPPINKQTNKQIKTCFWSRQQRGTQTSRLGAIGSSSGWRRLVSLSAGLSGPEEYVISWYGRCPKKTLIQAGNLLGWNGDCSKVFCNITVLRYWTGRVWVILFPFVLKSIPLAALGADRLRQTFWGQLQNKSGWRNTCFLDCS